MINSTLIRNRDRAKQLLAFDGMQYGKCSPSDIDISMDFQGKYFVFAELKGKGVPLTLGQKIHLTYLVDAIVAGGRQAVAILAHHDTPSTSHDVHCAQAQVHSVYYGGGTVGHWGAPQTWERVLKNQTLNELITELHSVYQLEKKL